MTNTSSLAAIPDARDDLDTADRRAPLVLLVTMLGTLMVFSSTTSMNVALPAISRALHPAAGVADWFLLSYMLANSALIPVFARVSDFMGRRTIFLAGVSVMTVASIAAGLSTTATELILMRAVQGVGAAIVLTNVNALIADAYSPSRRPAALGINVMGSSVASALGPVLGGWLVQTFGWQAVLFVNVPFGVASVIIGLFMLPKVVIDRADDERFDATGAALSVVLLFSLLFAINRLSAWGVGDWRVLTGFGVAVVGLVLFIVVESRHRSPLMDLDLIKGRTRWPAYAAVFCISIPQSTLPVVIVLHEQLVLHRSVAGSGIVIIPFAVVVAMTAPVAGRLVGRFPPQRLPMLGGLILAAGLGILLLSFRTDAPWWITLVALVVAGFGNGLFHTPNISLIMSGIPNNRFGVAGGIRSVLFNSSQAIGTAIVLLLLGSYFRAHGAQGLDVPVKNGSVMEPGFVMVGVLMIVLALLCALLSAIGGHSDKAEKARATAGVASETAAS